MIKLQVIGHLGKDCLLNQVNGKSVMNLSVAHSEKFKDSAGELKERTTWVDCAYWSERTAVAPYLKKGTLVYAEGTPEVRNYQKADGTPGSSLSLRVSGVQLLGKSDNGDDQNGQQAYPRQAQPAAPYSAVPMAADAQEPMDDLPF